MLAVSVTEVRPPFGSGVDHFFTVIDDVITGLFAVREQSCLTRSTPAKFDLVQIQLISSYPSH